MAVSCEKHSVRDNRIIHAANINCNLHMEFANELRYVGRFSIRGRTEQIASFHRYKYNDIYSFSNLSSRARENLWPGIHIYANQHGKVAAANIQPHVASTRGDNLAALRAFGTMNPFQDESTSR